MAVLALITHFAAEAAVILATPVLLALRGLTRRGPLIASLLALPGNM